ncbi:MAG: hypothetical protein QW757_05200 [Candidatus Woesearchaeota archaeon]
MSNLIDNLKNIEKEQDSLVEKFKKIVEKIDSLKKVELIKENEKNLLYIKKLEDDLTKLKEKLELIRKENETLRISLNEKIIDEKLNILKISKDKLETYFGKAK